MDVQAQAKREHILFISFFVLLRPLVDWMMSTHIGEGVFLFSVLIQVVISSISILMDTPRNNVLPII